MKAIPRGVPICPIFNLLLSSLGNVEVNVQVCRDVLGEGKELRTRNSVPKRAFRFTPLGLALCFLPQPFTVPGVYY